MPAPEQSGTPSDGSKDGAPAKRTDQSTSPNDTWSWSAFSSWPASLKLLPAVVPLIGIWIAVYYQRFFVNPDVDIFGNNYCVANFNYTFNIFQAKYFSQQPATHDWEFGTAAEALLELMNPEESVFGSNPFPRGKIPSSIFKLGEALNYVYQSRHIRLDGTTLYENTYSVSDPASLGVSALLIGQQWPVFLQAAQRQHDYLIHNATRYGNGAISHRVEVPELWSDAVFMFPPFLAYYAVSVGSLSMMREAVRQCELYKEVLIIRGGEKRGLWKHIVGPSDMADDGAWSTGNAWAAYGMLRVRATIAGWLTSRTSMKAEVTVLDTYIEEILEAVMRTDNDESGLLRNYLGDDSWFGEASGTALLAAAAFRQAAHLDSGLRREKLLTWAHRKRRAVIESTGHDGIAKPVVSPYKHDQREPLDGPSPEGESFLLLMAAAWRDCVCAKVCSNES